MSSDLTILISSAGRRVGLIDCFRLDAAALGLKLRVVAADLRPKISAACRKADIAYEVPSCTDPRFVSCVREIVAREQVRLIVPTIDTELNAYAATADEFASLGAVVSISGERTVQIARDKFLTAEVLQAAQVSVPRTARLEAFRSQQAGWRWPVILKPKGGSSSIGIRKVSSPSELDGFESGQSDYMVQEFWEGREYTVNMFFDRAGQLRSVVPHLRMEVRAGEVSKGRTEHVPALIEIAHRIASILPQARGVLCFQAIVTPRDEVAVIEVNARFGGGYPLAHAAGATFSKWLLEEVAGLPSSITSSWREGVTMLRYDAAVFVE